MKGKESMKYRLEWSKLFGWRWVCRGQFYWTDPNGVGLYTTTGNKRFTRCIRDVDVANIHKPEAYCPQIFECGRQFCLPFAIDTTGAMVIRHAFLLPKKNRRKVIRLLRRWRLEPDVID